MMNKTFSKLTEKDSIYYISPITFQVEGYKIKEIKGATPEQIFQQPQLRHFVVIEVYHNVLALQSEDITKIPTLKFILDGRLTAQFCIVKVGLSKDNQPKMPVPFFADIRTAETWKNQG